jgi:hypothetical protein
VAIAIFFCIKTMKYRLDEGLVNPKTKGLKRFVWIEPYYLSPDDYGELDKVYTEDYRQIDLIEALKDIQNHQIRFNPNHRDGIYNI